VRAAAAVAATVPNLDRQVAFGRSLAARQSPSLAYNGHFESVDRTLGAVDIDCHAPGVLQQHERKEKTVYLGNPG